jgi:hypothetical protein
MIDDTIYSAQLARAKILKMQRDELAALCGVVDDPIPDDAERDAPEDDAGPEPTWRFLLPLAVATVAVFAVVQLALWLADHVHI